MEVCERGCNIRLSKYKYTYEPDSVKTWLNDIKIKNWIIALLECVISSKHFLKIQKGYIIYYENVRSRIIQAVQFLYITLLTMASMV